MACPTVPGAPWRGTPIAVIHFTFTDGPRAGPRWPPVAVRPWACWPGGKLSVAGDFRPARDAGAESPGWFIIPPPAHATKPPSWKTKCHSGGFVAPVPFGTRCHPAPFRPQGLPKPTERRVKGSKKGRQALPWKGVEWWNFRSSIMLHFSSLKKEEGMRGQKSSKTKTGKGV